MGDSILFGYPIEGVIAQSFHSTVYRTQSVKGQHYVLKVLNENYPSIEQLARFQKEYQLTHSLKADCLVRAHELKREQHRWAMVLEDFGGKSLNHLIPATGMELATFYEIAVQAVAALEVIHAQRIIHKDINPFNLLWHPQKKKLQIIDFGIASTLPHERAPLKPTNVMEGTLAYLSPEQTGRMNRVVDYRSDFYALGVTLYEMLLGQLPFSATSPIEWIHRHLAAVPRPPHELRSEIPQSLSRLVLKLLNKNPEDRYQSLAGIAADLVRCRQGDDGFAPGLQDASDRFELPQKLYGRESERAQLMEAFGRARNGGSHLILIKGYSGIGKTSLIREIHQPVAESQGFFMTGKFNQYQNSTPYAALLNAFRGFFRELSTLPRAELDHWSRLLEKALVPNMGFLVKVLPELEWLIGHPIPEEGITGSEAVIRFQEVFESLVGIFARKEHPLVLFIDDLQWADDSSLVIINHWVRSSQLNHFLLIGAYRDNEVDRLTPLQLILDALTQDHIHISELSLTQLSIGDIHQFTADALNRSLESTLELAELVLQKTSGNPFFMGIFLDALREKGILAFSKQLQERNRPGGWSFDLARIRKEAVTGNVVGLLLEKLHKLSPETRQVLRVAAALGNHFELSALMRVLPDQESIVKWAGYLVDALREGLLISTGAPIEFATLELDHIEEKVRFSFQFSHDRAQEAAYSLISEQERPLLHWRVGLYLLQHAMGELPALDQAPFSFPEGMLARLELLCDPEHEAPALLKQRIFQIAHHLSVGSYPLDAVASRLVVAAVSLLAGKQAHASAAFQQAFLYLERALGLLFPNQGEDVNKLWSQHHGWLMELHVSAAACAVLAAQKERMEILIQTILERARSPLEKGKAYSLLMDAAFADQDVPRIREMGLLGLREMGVVVPDPVTALDVDQAYQRLEQSLAQWKQTSVEALPVMDSATRDMFQVYWTLTYATSSQVSHLHLYMTFSGSELLLHYRPFPRTLGFLTGYASWLCGEERFAEARDMIELAVARLKAVGFEPPNHVLYNHICFIRHWTADLREDLHLLLDAYHRFLKEGDLAYAYSCLSFYLSYAFWGGKKLAVLSKEIESQLKIMVDAGWKGVDIDWVGYYQQTVARLTEPSTSPSCVLDEEQDRETVLRLFSSPDPTALDLFLYTNKLCQIFLFFDREQAAFAVLDREDVHKGNVTSTHMNGIFNYFDALLRLRLAGEDPQLAAQVMPRVDANLARLELWAEHSPVNFAQKYQLVLAERHRVFGELSQARDAYDRAMDLADRHQFIQDEAMACELAGLFYLRLGNQRAAGHYLQDAHYAYGLWGASAKQAFMEQRHPTFLVEHRSHQGKSSVGGRSRVSGQVTARELDVQSLAEGFKVISSQIVLDRLLEKVLSILAENAGAAKGALLLPEGKKGWTASARYNLDADAHLPWHIINYVAASRELLVLDDANRDLRFARDPALHEQDICSVLCAPVHHQGKLAALLYLQNDLAAGAFSPERVNLVVLLATQAAISMENASLYNSLEQKVEDRTLEARRMNRQITDSITYAKRIQEAMLPQFHEIQQVLPNTLVIYQPKDIVSGDFYWCNKQGDLLLLAVIDCTGHGVPGAFLSMIGHSLLNQIAADGRLDDPAEILERLNLEFCRLLRSRGSQSAADGMELSLIRLNTATHEVSFCGARLPLYHIRPGREQALLEIKGNRKSIGGHARENRRRFTNHNLTLQKGDMLYMATDGYHDQPNPKGWSYGSTRFKTLLAGIANGPISQQEQRLRNELENHRADAPQRDDITVIGIGF